jgi:hypothetical protein
MSEAKRQVTLAYPYEDPESGKTFDPDSTHSLPIEEADRLLNAGLAREPEKKD